MANKTTDFKLMATAPKGAQYQIDIWITNIDDNVERVPDSYWSESRSDWVDPVTDLTFEQVYYVPIAWQHPQESPNLEDINDLCNQVDACIAELKTGFDAFVAMNRKDYNASQIQTHAIDTSL